MSVDRQDPGFISRSLRKIDSGRLLFYRKALRPLDRSVSRATTKTAARLSHHAVGRIAVSNARRGSNVEHDGSRELRWESSDDDFKKLGQPYDQSLIDSLSDKFDELLADEAYTFTQEHEGEIYGMGMKSADFDYARHLPEVGELVNDDVRSIVREYYDSHFKPMRINVYRNLHVPPHVVQDSDVYSNSWHCDDRTTDHFKLFVTLSDVMEQDGPFHVISKADTRRMIANGYNRNKDGVSNEFVESNAEVQKFTGPKGSAAVCNTELQLHRAGIPDEGCNRDMVMISFVPTDEPLPDDWIQQPEIYSHECQNGVRRLFSY